ncbi:MAG: CcmD family protein [Actinomycetota bacterium]
MSNTSWLIVALVIVAAAIGAYVWTLTARRQNLARRLDELRRDERQG